MINHNDTELRIWKELASSFLSPSHDSWHINLVIDYVKQLQKIKGGDLKILIPAVILHDLGRNDPFLHKEESIKKSIIDAKKILERTDFSDEEIFRILEVIQDHDKPNFTPVSLEGKILKDADFLAGFGAWGILRVSFWAIEGGNGTHQVLKKLRNDMVGRIEGLEFDESKKLAKQQYYFVKLFLQNLETNQQIQSYKGKYLVLEGVSGSGKNAQANRLIKNLNANGFETIFVEEPTNDVYNKIKGNWKSQFGEDLSDPIIRRYLLLADRMKLIENIVIPALKAGKIVVSSRSFMSFLVYQCSDVENNVSDEKYLPEFSYYHKNVPIPDLVILYDLPPEIANTRIEKRGRVRSNYENIKQLSLHRKIYKKLVCSNEFSLRNNVLDAELSIDELEVQTWNIVKSIL